MMEEPKIFLREELGKRFNLKEKSIISLEQRLGEKVSHLALENGVKCWSFSSPRHAQAAVKNVEDYRSRSNIFPLLKAKSPCTSDYLTETDDTPELSPTKTYYYKSMIGVMQWIV